MFAPVDGELDRSWIEERLGGWATIHSVVPRGYEVYVRVFHPVEVELIGDTHPDLQWAGRRVMRWAEVAELTGRVAHPLMQWESISRELPDRLSGLPVWRWMPPELGRLPADALARVVSLVAARSVLVPGLGNRLRLHRDRVLRRRCRWFDGA